MDTSWYGMLFLTVVNTIYGELGNPEGGRNEDSELQVRATCQGHLGDIE
jgi:hypothetical protein